MNLKTEFIIGPEKGTVKSDLQRFCSTYFSILLSQPCFRRSCPFLQ